MRKKALKGQDTMEFIVVFPIFLFILGAMIVLATQWHSFHVTSESALEAASRSGNSPMMASWEAEDIATSEFANGNYYVSYSNTNDFSPNSIGEFKGFKSDGVAPGIFNLIRSSLLGDKDTKGYVQVPEWKYKPCSSSCGGD